MPDEGTPASENKFVFDENKLPVRFLTATSLFDGHDASINIMRRIDLIKWGSCVGKRPFFYILDNIQAKDIDNKDDFIFCETIFKNKKR